jgi:hypothetical protein
MSLAHTPVQTFQTLDPVTDVGSRRGYAVLKGGSQVTYQVVTATTSDSSGFIINAPPPNPGVIVDRKILAKIPITVSITGVANKDARLINPGHDAFRYMPVSSIISTLSATINTTQVTINLADLIHPLSRYNTGIDVRLRDYSGSPSMQDQYQDYADANGANRNELAGYSENNYEVGRGSFPLTSITNPQSPDASITPITAVVTTDLYEYLYLSPFLFGHGQGSGFIGVQTLDFAFRYEQNITRAWSHALIAGSSVVITNITVTFGAPSLLFRYITPSLISVIPKSVVYSYYNIQSYTTTSSNTVAPNATTTIITNNVQLRSIPRRIYICARKRKVDRTYLDSDTYYSMENLKFNWNNGSGALSTASKMDLYQMSRQNGCNLSWTQWSGTAPSSDLTGIVGTVGSVCCVSMGQDVALNADEAPGLLGTFQVTVEALIKNCHQTETTIPELVLIVVSEGVFTVVNNQAVTQIGCVSKEDVLFSRNSPFIKFDELSDALGGNFFSGLKNFGEQIWKGIKTVGKELFPIAKEMAQGVKAGIPIGLEASKTLAPLAMPLLGLGNGIVGDGALVGGRRRRRRRAKPRARARPRRRRKGMGGGKMMSRAQLRKRLFG